MAVTLQRFYIIGADKLRDRNRPLHCIFLKDWCRNTITASTLSGVFIIAALML
jgi:hypothetical protein